MFSIKDKVALVTGSASGIGLSYVKELLRNGLKGVVVADIDPGKGAQALKEIAEEFGNNKAVFIKTDVTVQKDVEAAFKKAIEVYNNLDIVINNAGILNDATWEKEIAININGTIYGCLLAWDYLQKYRSDSETVIVNISSIAGLEGFMSIPVYTATKHAITGFSKSIGNQHYYNNTGIKIITICPGVTNTPLITTMETASHFLPPFQNVMHIDLQPLPMQEPEIVAKGMVQAIQTGETGSFWVINNSKVTKLNRVPEDYK